MGEKSAHRTLFCVALMLLASSVGAARSRFQGDTTLLPEAVVLESRILPPVSHGQVASPLEIARSEGIADLVGRFSSVQVKDYGGVGGLKTVNVRSLGSEHTGVFIDGVAVDNSQNMQVDLGRFSLEDFSSVAVFSGQRSYPLQSAREYSVGSSLHLARSKPVLERGSSIRASLLGGSFATLRSSLGWDRRLSSHLTSSLSASVLSSDGHYDFKDRKTVDLPGGVTAGYDTTMTRKNSDIFSYSLTGTLWGDWRGLRSNLVVYYYDSERGLPGPVVRRPQDAITCLDRQTDRNFFIQAGGTWESSGRVSISAKAKYSKDFLHYRTNPWKDPQAMPYNNRYHQWSVYGSVSLLYRIARWWSLSAAIDGQYNALDANIANFVNPDRTTLWAALGSYFYLGDWTLSGTLVYINARDTFSPKADPGGFSKKNATRDAFAPSLVLGYRPSFLAGLSFDGFVKRSYRLPSFNDLYYTLVGNSSLSPEDALQTSVGAQYRGSLLPRLALDATTSTYYNRIKDKIVAVPTANQFRWSMYNIGKSRILGWEGRAILSCTLVEGEDRFSSLVVSLGGGYTYQKALDYSFPERSSYKGQLPYIPRHSSTFSSSLEWRGWDISVQGTSVGRRWASSSNFPDWEVEGFTVVDMAIIKDIPIPRGRLRARLSFNNFTFTSYEVVKGYPMPRGNLLGGVEYKF